MPVNSLVRQFNDVLKRLELGDADAAAGAKKIFALDTGFTFQFEAVEDVFENLALSGEKIQIRGPEKQKFRRAVSKFRRVAASYKRGFMPMT